MYEVKQTTRRTWSIEQDGSLLPIAVLFEEKPGLFEPAKKYDLSVEDLRRLHAAIGVALTDLAGERVEAAMDEQPGRAVPADAPF